MKRTCYGCRALTTQLYCAYGFNIEKTQEELKDHPGVARTLCKPTQECPKPRTYEELHRLNPVVKSALFLERYGHGLQ